MHCNYLNKFICKTFAIRCMSSQLQVNTEQLYFCFKKSPIEDLKALKFVPTNEPPKVAPKCYHNTDQQIMISKRICSLKTPKLGDTSVLENCIQASNVESNESIEATKSGSAKNYTKTSEEMIPQLEKKSVEHKASRKLILHIRDSLQDLSKNIKNDLMKIDDSLKQKLKVIKAKFDKRHLPNIKKEDLLNSSPPANVDNSFYEKNQELLPTKRKRSRIEEMSDHTKLLDFKSSNSILSRNPKPLAMSRLRRDLTSVDTPYDGRLYAHQLLEPFKITGQLMEVDQKPEMKATNGTNHILGIIAKNAVDADGVYLVSNKIKTGG